MHFWIDKPATRYHSGFRGRRYPTVSFPKGHRQCSNLDGGRVQMATPVHRFQNASSGGAPAGPSNSNSARHLRNSTQGINDNRRNSTQGFQPGHDAINNSSDPGNNQQILPQSSNNTNGGTSNFSEFSYADMTNYKLRCSVWIIFLMITGFAAAARFYFVHQGFMQGAGFELLVFCGLLVILLMSGYFYSIACRHMQNTHHQEIPTEPVASVSVVDPTPAQSIRPMPPRQNPPPPYHIAILIPQPNLEEAPPPAYDKIIQ
ncbi:hypothetical protein QAD02_015201 [Eretmocerus hayati]|uniref:Uncharacterized protein n=1 Tax=Eretmocerus hayati TaxID=131215 RepID=A0ACC2PA18_9HYME|nr:hypothetical protein QAD02_015201 [Eretmocerus hayati]